LCQPLVQKVVEAQCAVPGGGMGGPGGVGRSSNRPSPVWQIKDALAKHRAARNDKQTKLKAALNSLKAVLSTRQKAQAVRLRLLA
jgi:hypothetical protein